MVGALWPSDAGAASWTNPTERGFAPGRDLSQVEAKGPIEDRILRPGRARASFHQPSRVESYRDPHGHTITIGTAIEGLDLQWFADILAGTIHRSELSELRVLVVHPDEVPAECGGDPGVVACYGADDPYRTNAGEMIVPADHPDLIHAIVHEYGHHMDNSLLNLGHLGLCAFDHDGSRRWFFARDAYDDLLGRSGCNRRVSYSRLLGELYAEDYVALNGIGGWGLSAFPPPTRWMLAAMRSDIRWPFRPRRRSVRRTMWRTRDLKLRRVRLRDWTFFEAVLRGPPRWYADLDLYLWRRRAPRRPLEQSLRPGSRERIERVLRPGRYVIGVRSHRGRGRFRLRLNLF